MRSYLTQHFTSLRYLIPLLSFAAVFGILKGLHYLNPTVSTLNTCFSAFIYLCGLYIAFIAAQPLLKLHWANFQLRKISTHLWIVIGFLGSHTIIYTVRNLLQYFSTPSPAIEVEPIATPTLGLFLASAILPFFAPLFEEIAFRHSFFKHLARTTPLTFLWAIISSIAFGLIHYPAFATLLDTLPYVAVGLFYCFIYHQTNNLFYTIFIHALVNWSTLFLALIGFIVT